MRACWWEVMRKKMKTDSPMIRELSALLEAQGEVRFAYLFGSRALGYSRPDSDLDLAVYFHEDASPWDEVSLEEELTDRIGIPVQVIHLGEKLGLHLLHGILSSGVIVKDSGERSEWERKARQLLDRGAEVRAADYREQLLDSMEKQVRRILKAIPLLDTLDLEKVHQDDVEALQHFIGAFLMLFEPVETTARKMARYAHLTLHISPEPEGLRDQMRLMVDILGLGDEAFEQLGQLARLRNRIVHAYWHIAQQEVKQLDLARIRGVFDKLVAQLSMFIIAERGRSNLEEGTG